MQISNMVISALQQGLCYALVAMGVYISYKILDFPDLSVDGTFPLGAVVSVMLVNSGINPVLAITVSLVCGGAAGFITGFLHVKFKISNLLSGIIVMTALLSINFNLGKEGGVIRVFISYNKDNPTLFSGGLVNSFDIQTRPLAKTLILFTVVVIFKYAIDLFLKTKAGFMLRAAGNNEQLVTAMGRQAGAFKIIGLMAANAMVAMAGAVYSQQMNFYDYTSGTGMVVIALASVIIGCTVFKNIRFVKGTTSVIIGAIIYSLCLSLAINIGISTNYLKLLMAVFFMLILILNEKIINKKTYHTILKRKI